MLNIPAHISRSFIESHREIIFLYGNDYYGRGCLGQAWSFFGEANTFPIPTLIKYCSAASFFYDNNPEFYKYIDEAIAKVPRDGRPIIACRRIGMGCSRMFELAPKLYAYMTTELNKIVTPVEWTYA